MIVLNISILYVPYAVQHSSAEHVDGMFKTIMDYLSTLDD